MLLVEVKLKNFRAYAQETSVPLNPLTVLIGRNDAGKSSVLDALDIFFNGAPIENDDCCVHTGASDVTISCVFEDYPKQLVIDEQHPTSLESEYLLREDGRLEVAKVYSCAGAKGKITNIVARARHPAAQGADDLLGLQIAGLRARAVQRGTNLVGINQAIKAHLRAAIWGQTEDLHLQDGDVSLLRESGKEVWEQLEKHFPVYALFKSDRASTDQDAEAQDPLKAAIKEAIRRREAELSGVLSGIRIELEQVANRTVEKIREMSPDLASQLHPEVKNKNWDSLFTVSLTGDEDIPINKRGSGTRRLVLLNFVRAKAEETSAARGTGVIYGVEEPETSQHPNHQIILLDAFEDLVAQERCQVILTTHTPTLARRVSDDVLRLVSPTPAGPEIELGTNEATLNKIRRTLGVLPDHGVKVFLGVEGKHDMNFLRRISAILARNEPDIPDLENEEQAGRLVFVPLAGSNMELWISRLEGFNRPEFYLTDRDQAPPAEPKYQRQIAQWQARGCTAWATSKRELENYLHPIVLAKFAPGYAGTGADDFEDVPALFAQAVHNAAFNAAPWQELTPEQRREKSSAAKRRLNSACVEQMTSELLAQSDPHDDIRAWLRAIGRALNA